MPELAQELIDSIVDALAADSISRGLWPGTNLAQCSLVSRSFRPRSLRHIFSSVNIRGDSHDIQMTKVQRLDEIIEDNPKIARYIEGLTLEPVCLPESSACPSLTEEQTFIAVMEKVSPLRKLTIESTIMRGIDHESFLDNFFLPFIAPSITSLNFGVLCRVPIEAVASCARLQSLSLLFADFAESDQLTRSTVPHVRPKLQRLSNISSHGAVHEFLRPSSCVDLSQLKSYTVYADEAETTDQVQAAIDLFSDSLEELHLLNMDYTAYNILRWRTLHLQRLSRLRTLHLHVPFSSHISKIETSVHFIHDLLSTVPTGSLDMLLIELKVGFVDLELPDDPKIVANADWNDVCSEITRVMASSGSTFEFKLACRHLVPSETHDSTEEEALLQTQCQSAIAELREHSFVSLRETPSIKLVLPDHARLAVYFPRGEDFLRYLIERPTINDNMADRSRLRFPASYRFQS